MCGDDDNARMPGMMETTGIGRFIKLSTATVYTVSGKIFILLSQKYQKSCRKLENLIADSHQKYLAHTPFFINTTFLFQFITVF